MVHSSGDHSDRLSRYSYRLNLAMLIVTVVATMIGAVALFA